VNRVLIVDDERAMLRSLGHYLQARGYDVHVAETGESAVARVRSVSYDVAIVDLGLPGIDGIDVIHAVRSSTSMPVIVLSACHDEARKIYALDAGADDYIMKPFSVAELVARLRATLRRARRCDEPAPVVETADFRVDLRAKRARSRDGAEIPLTATQWSVLEVLVRNPDRLVSQRELLEEVWGPAYLNQANYVRQFIAQLRKKFEPDPSQPRYFLTQPGLGVRFVPALEFDGTATVSS
jgi:two-component system KDP operon response regulator KdpE